MLKNTLVLEKNNSFFNKRKITNGEIGFPILIISFILITLLTLWWTFPAFIAYSEGMSFTKAISAINIIADTRGIDALKEIEKTRTFSFIKVSHLLPLYNIISTTFSYITKILFWLAMFSLGWKFYLAFRYKSIPSVSNDDLPSITVVIPAYNEGKGVFNTLVSVIESDYPSNKLQIIAVDDGSKDDTFDWIKNAVESYPDRIEYIKMIKNSGKRAALNEGFKNARGTIFVTIDSDSIIAKETLRNLVSPFVKDESIGAVAGNVKVLNYNEGFYPKIMDIAFTMSFDFLRLAQSKINTVFCTPGALSAYRSEIIFPHLDEWVNEEFLGHYANIGEDRGLANIVTKKGFHIIFQQNAIVWTMVPTKYMGLCKMMIRWARSHVRESIVMGQYIFKKFRKSGTWGTRFEFILQMIDLIFTEAFKIGTIGLLILCPLVVLKGLLIGTAIASIIPGFIYLIRYKSIKFLWAIPYSYFYVLGLSWVSFWSLLTPHRSGWLTRNLG